MAQVKPTASQMIPVFISISKSSLSVRAINPLVYLLRNAVWASTNDNDNNVT